MSIIGLDTEEYKCNYIFLDKSLLKMRNEIVLGENLSSLSLDQKRFDELYSKITKMMNFFVNQIENAVIMGEFLAKIDF